MSISAGRLPAKWVLPFPLGAGRQALFGRRRNLLPTNRLHSPGGRIAHLTDETRINK